MNANKFTDKVIEALQQAHELALSNGQSQFGPAHVASSLFEDQEGLARRLAGKVGADITAITQNLNLLIQKVPRQDPPPTEASANSALATILRNADSLRGKDGDSFVAVDHLVRALSVEKTIKPIFEAAGLTSKALDDAVAAVRQGGGGAQTRNAEDQFDALSKYARDLTALAREGKLDPVIGRHQEMDRAIRILARRTKNNVILLGPPGTGKTTIAVGLAQRIAAGDVPESLEATIWELDVASLIAGASHRGEFEERLKSVLNELEKASTPQILFIDEIHSIMNAGGGEASNNAAQYLKPALARGELRVIGATTLDEYKKFIEKDKAFERRFQPIQVQEPTVEETVSILRGLKESYQTHHNVQIQDSALVLAAKLAKRYVTTRFLPDSAIDLLDEAAAATRVQLDSAPEELDRMERKQLQLEVEITALKNEKDTGSKDRLKKAEKELSELNEAIRPMKAKYEAERTRIEELRRVRHKIQELEAKLVQAERARDLARISDLKHGALPELRSHLENLLKQDAEYKATSTDRLVTEVVSPTEIAEIVSRWTKIPLDKLKSSESSKLLKLEERLGAKVIGQANAVKAVSEAIIRSRSGLAPPNRPIGSFLFLGQSGTGKTQLAKALAGDLLDDEEAVTRIDMSEYMEKHSTSRLVGSPPGYVGFEEGGQLTEAVLRRPFSVVLFDEVEKAHPDVLNVLLQVLDDGRLTDSKGRTVDFKNTVIILTSNIGAQALLEAAEQEEEMGGSPKRLRMEAHDQVMQEVRGRFRPEFLNRLDEIIIFDALRKEQLMEIVRLQLKEVMWTLQSDRNIFVEASPDVLARVVDEAYDPRYGARPLRRFIERRLATELGKKIIGGEVPDYSDVRIMSQAEASVDTLPSDSVTPIFDGQFIMKIAGRKANL